MSGAAKLHTDGKWEVHPASYGYDIFSVPELVGGLYPRGLLWIASVTTSTISRIAQIPYPPRDECEANAHLIAAAPDLLAALQGLLSACEQGVDPFESPHHSSVAAARATIRLASPVLEREG